MTKCYKPLCMCRVDIISSINMRACDDHFHGYLQPKCAIGFNPDDDLHGQGDYPRERTTDLIARQHGRFSGIQS